MKFVKLNLWNVTKILLRFVKQKLPTYEMLPKLKEILMKVCEIFLNLCENVLKCFWICMKIDWNNRNLCENAGGMFQKINEI